MKETLDEEAYHQFVKQLQDAHGRKGLSLKDFPQAPVVSAWFEAIRTVGKEKVEEEPWWKEFRNNAEYQAIVDVKTLGFPVHYVTGIHSPFYQEIAISKDCSKATLAIYASPFTSNGASVIGTMQGGAQSSLFDFSLGYLASQFVKYPSPTAYINVQMKKPAYPIPSVLRLDIWIDKSRTTEKKIYVQGRLSNGNTGKVFAEADSLSIFTNRKGRMVQDLQNSMTKAPHKGKL